jgi:hypothetical protein
MSQVVCIVKEPPQEIECLCYDNKPCNIHIDDGGNLVCRYGSNEGIVDGIAKVICPLEIESERKKWEAFLKQELERTQPNE